MRSLLKEDLEEGHLMPREKEVPGLSGRNELYQGTEVRLELGE